MGGGGGGDGGKNNYKSDNDILRLTPPFVNLLQWIWRQQWDSNWNRWRRPRSKNRRKRSNAMGNCLRRRTRKKRRTKTVTAMTNDGGGGSRIVDGR